MLWLHYGGLMMMTDDYWVKGIILLLLRMFFQIILFNGL